LVGQAQGVSNPSKIGGVKTGVKSYQDGLIDGAQIALELVDKHMKGGLTSVLDWETAQRLLREQMSRN
jgi:outer membrane protein TolC